MTEDTQDKPAAGDDAPRCVPAFVAHVTIGSFLQVGPSKHGMRQLVPITGGTVSGPMLQGEVVPGGADWQLVRPDRVLEVDARYTIRASDGALIHVRNRGIWHMLGGESYVRTTPQFEAPLEGPHAALNQAVFVGSIALAPPGAVRVSVFKVV